VFKSWGEKNKVKMLRRIFGPRRKEVNGNGENYIMLCLMNCIPHPKVFG
jgi:hypothetical protein